MNIIFIDYKNINSKSKMICYLYKKYGFWIKKYKNRKIYTIIINPKSNINNKLIIKALNHILKEENYIVLSKKISNDNNILKILKEYSNAILVTEQNNLLKNDINYINSYIGKNNIDRNDVRILFIIDEINDIIISKLYYFIKKYKILDIKLNDFQNYKSVEKIVRKINQEEGTVIDIVDKIQQKNYNIILVFSKKQKFFYDDSSYILDYNNSDLDICSNTYLIYEKYKQQFLYLFKLIDMDISRFEKTKLGKLYIHTSGIILDR